MSNWGQPRERLANIPNLNRPDFLGDRPENDLSYLQKLLIEMVCQFGLISLEDMKKVLTEEYDRYVDLVMLQEVDDDEFGVEAEQLGRKVDRLREEFHIFISYLEHLAVNYFTSDVRRDQFLESLHEIYF